MYAKLAFGNMRRSLKDYGIYFATLVIGVCLFYAFNSITQQNTVLDLSKNMNQTMELLSTMISGVSVFLAVIMGFLVVYANRFLVRRRKKEFAIYLTLGMERRQVSRILVLETLLVGLVSLGWAGVRLPVVAGAAGRHSLAFLGEDDHVLVLLFTASCAGHHCVFWGDVSGGAYIQRVRHQTL